MPGARACGGHTRGDSWVDEAKESTEEDLEVFALDSGFEAFYRSELRAIVGVVYALTGSRWISEELAHDAFLTAYRRWDQVAAYDRPGAFVRRVAINLARSRHRRVASEARALARYAIGQRPEVQTLPPADTEFWAEVRRLPRRQAEVLALRYVEDLSDAQIAEILGCSEATVRVHVHRAKETLAASLTEDDG